MFVPFIVAFPNDITLIRGLTAVLAICYKKITKFIVDDEVTLLFFTYSFRIKKAENFRGKLRKNKVQKQFLHSILRKLFIHVLCLIT